MEKLSAFRKACDKVSDIIGGAEIEEYPNDLSDECLISFENIHTGNMESVSLFYDSDDGGYDLHFSGFIEFNNSLHVDNLSDINGKTIDRLFKGEE